MKDIIYCIYEYIDYKINKYKYKNTNDFAYLKCFNAPLPSLKLFPYRISMLKHTTRPIGTGQSVVQVKGFNWWKGRHVT